MSGIPVILIVDTELTYFYFVENYINVLFEIEQMAATLYFMHNTIFNELSGQTTMSGVSENPMADTKITNLLLFWRKWYQFIVYLEHMAAMSDFTHNAMSLITFWPYHYTGRTRKPHGRHQNRESAAIL